MALVCFFGVVDAGVVDDIDAKVCGGVSAEVLVWEEEDFYIFVFFAGDGAAVHRPFKDLLCVGGGAAGAAVLSYERFDGGGGVDIGDGDDAALPVLLFERFVDDVPCFDGLFIVGHVGHGAAGRQVWENDFDGVGGEDVCGFCHEVDAAEDDVLDGGSCLGSFFDYRSRELCEFEGVSGEVGVLDDGVHLVVVAEDEEFFAELFSALLYAGEEFLLGELVVRIGDGGLPEHVLIVGGEEKILPQGGRRDGEDGSESVRGWFRRSRMCGDDG